MIKNQEIDFFIILILEYIIYILLYNYYEVYNMLEVENRASIVYFLVLIFLVFLLACSFIGVYYYEEKLEQREQTLEKERIEAENLERENAIKFVKNDLNNLYDEDIIPKNDVTDDEIKNILDDINKIEDEEIRSSLLMEVLKINEYRDVENKINSLLINDVLISNYKESDLEELDVLIKKLPDNWQEVVNKKVEIIDDQIDRMRDAEKKIKDLYSDANLTKIKNNVTRKSYNDAKKAVDRLLQKDLKSKYQQNLNNVLAFIEDKEEKARIAAEEKTRKEAEIKAAWVILETPYISQNNNKIYNGCEAAALLMGLQYKGYLKGTSLKTFVDNMPKSVDNPHEGFVRDIYGVEPKDIPHWIAPDALAKYGREFSGNNEVRDITGTSVTGLKKELDKDNPVVIYATGGMFADPVNWVEEVPNNVHVMLLIGYNPKNNQVLINDPWTRKSTGKVYLSESRFTEIYNKVGKKAVVIR